MINLSAYAELHKRTEAAYQNLQVGWRRSRNCGRLTRNSPSLRSMHMVARTSWPSVSLNRMVGGASMPNWQRASAKWFAAK